MWDEPTSPDTNTMLYLATSSVRMPFLFLCLIHNGVGSLSVSVIASPSSLDEHETFSLSCFVHSSYSRKVAIMWTKDGKPLKIDGHNVTQLRPELVYVRNARSSDSGTYKCAATVDSTTRYGTARVTVRGIVTIRSVNEHVSVTVGHRARLECEGQNLREVLWYKRWVPIGESSKYQIANSISLSVLIISDVKFSDFGLYQCRSGSTATATVQLTVKMPPLPRITLHPQSIAPAKGSHAELHCQAIGLPPPTIHWVKKHGQREVHIQKNGSLEFSAVSDRHTGIYQCVAENSHGSVRSSYVTVTVEDKDMAEVKVRSYGENATSVILTCDLGTSSQSGIGIVRWYKDGKLIKVDNTKYTSPYYSGGAALLIQKVKCVDDGTYNCSFFVDEKLNRFCQTRLIVDGPPVPPSSIHVDIDCHKSPGKLKVTWLPSPCFKSNVFSGYIVTITVLSKRFPALVEELIAEVGATSVDAHVALTSLTSCSNCDLAYGVEVRAKSISGNESDSVRPSSASSRGEGRKCDEENASNAILLSTPAARIWMIDQKCSCAKSPQVLNIRQRVIAFADRFVYDAYKNVTGTEVNFKSEIVSADDVAMSYFAYRARFIGHTFREAIKAVSIISKSLLSQRRQQKDSTVSERCQVVFADCRVLFLEQSRNPTCDIKKSCSVPASLERIRKWCT